MKCIWLKKRTYHNLYTCIRSGIAICFHVLQGVSVFCRKFHIIETRSYSYLFFLILPWTWSFFFENLSYKVLWIRFVFVKSVGRSLWVRSLVEPWKSIVFSSFWRPPRRRLPDLWRTLTIDTRSVVQYTILCSFYTSTEVLESDNPLLSGFYL